MRFNVIELFGRYRAGNVNSLYNNRLIFPCLEKDTLVFTSEQEISPNIYVFIQLSSLTVRAVGKTRSRGHYSFKHPLYNSNKIPSSQANTVFNGQRAGVHPFSAHSSLALNSRTPQAHPRQRAHPSDPIVAVVGAATSAVCVCATDGFDRSRANN